MWLQYHVLRIFAASGNEFWIIQAIIPVCVFVCLFRVLVDQLERPESEEKMVTLGQE